MKKISHRFASVLLDVALKENSATDVLLDLNVLETVFNDSEIKEFFNEHLVPKSKKLEVIQESLKERRPEVKNLLTVLIEKDQFRLFSEIHKLYETLYNHAFKRIEVQVTTAYQLEDKQIGALKEAIDAHFGIDSIIEMEVDSNLIQGINIRMGDVYYEGSLRKSLQELGHHLRKGVHNVE